MTCSEHPITDRNNIWEVNIQQMAQHMEQLFSKLQVEMKRAQAIQAEQANKSQRSRTELQVGDKVWMDAWNLSTA